MSSSCVHLCCNFFRREGTKNTRFNVSNCAVYLADSCLISRFFALFTSSRFRVLAYSSFSCSCDVFLSSCIRVLAFSQTRVLVFIVFSRFIPANSRSRILASAYFSRSRWLFSQTRMLAQNARIRGNADTRCDESATIHFRWLLGEF